MKTREGGPTGSQMDTKETGTTREMRNMRTQHERKTNDCRAQGRPAGNKQAKCMG